MTMGETPENKTAEQATATTEGKAEAENSAVEQNQEAESQETIDQTKGELGDFVGGLTKSLEAELHKKYGTDSFETMRILNKVNDLAKVGIGLKVKGAINTVLGFFGVVKKFKPDLQIPAGLADIQDKITPLADQIDQVESQFSGLTSGDFIAKSMLEAQGVDPSQFEQGGQDKAVIDNALMSLESESKKLKEQKNITPTAYKLGFAKLLQGFIATVKGGTVASSETATAASSTEAHDNHEHDEEAYYDTAESSSTEVKEGEFLYSMPLGFPIADMKQANITSHQGPRKAPKAGASTNHQGVDIGLPVGTEVVTPAPGKVITVKEQPGGAGKYVEVDHGNFITRYFHLNTQDVKEGDIVEKGQKIATLGNTGNSTGPHLHYEIRDKSQIANAGKINSAKYKAVNPEDFWDFDGDGQVVAMQTYKDQIENADKSQVA